MLNYVIKRLLGLIPTLFIVSVLVFLFVHMLPGDPARLIAGPEADAQVIELVRQQLGLDQPLYHQFWHYISNAVQGDFGLSMVSRRPVADEIASRFMPTLWLTITSMVWAVIFGMAAGIIAAVWRNRWPDRLSMTIAVSGISFPAFALGMLLIQVFSVELGWLPTVGADSWQHYILPSLTLGAAVAAVMARFHWIVRPRFITLRVGDTRRYHTSSWRCIAREGYFHQRRAVNGVIQRLTDLRVIERLLRHVHTDITLHN